MTTNLRCPACGSAEYTIIAPENIQGDCNACKRFTDERSFRWLRARNAELAGVIGRALAIKSLWVQSKPIAKDADRLHYAEFAALDKMHDQFVTALANNGGTT